MSIVIVEGNIASGKSTLLSSLDKEKYNVIDEPLKMFCELGSFNPLQLHYKGELSSSAFSSYITNTLIHELNEKLTTDKTNIVCRSAYSTVNCFAAVSLEQQRITKEEYEILLFHQKIYEQALKGYNVYHVFINTSVENCFEQYKKRNRKEEELIDFEYLYTLDHYHKQYPIPWSCEINGNQNKDSIKNDFESFLNEKKL